MNRLTMSVVLACAAMTGASACAQTMSAAASSPSAPSGALYAEFGGKEGVDALTHDLVQRVAHDPRIASYFEHTQLERLSILLSLQFCQLMDGPCAYGARDMKTAHEGMGVTHAAFNALVEDLQAAMVARNIPFHAQNELLAKLAPMHRDIIEKP